MSTQSQSRDKHASGFSPSRCPSPTYPYTAGQGQGQGLLGRVCAGVCGCRGRPGIRKKKGASRHVGVAHGHTGFWLRCSSVESDAARRDDGTMRRRTASQTADGADGVTEETDDRRPRESESTATECPLAAQLRTRQPEAKTGARTFRRRRWTDASSGPRGRAMAMAMTMVTVSELVGQPCMADKAEQNRHTENRACLQHFRDLRTSRSRCFTSAQDVCVSVGRRTCATIWVSMHRGGVQSARVLLVSRCVGVGVETAGGTEDTAFLVSVGLTTQVKPRDFKLTHPAPT